MESSAVTKIHWFIYSLISPIQIISAVGTSTLVSTYLWRVCMFQILPASVAVAVVRKILILWGLKVKFPQPPLSDLKTAGLSKNPEVNILGNIWHCQRCSAFSHWTFLCLCTSKRSHMSQIIANPSVCVFVFAKKSKPELLFFANKKKSNPGFRAKWGNATPIILRKVLQLSDLIIQVKLWSL